MSAEHGSAHCRNEQSTPSGSDGSGLIKREFVLSAETDESLSRLVQVLRGATRSRLTYSHVARAILIGIEHCMTTIAREASALGPMKLPSNAKGRDRDREAFERRLAGVLLFGIRSAPSLDVPSRTAEGSRIGQDCPTASLS